MKEDVYIQENITIPGHELEITASRAGGPGGQHVNKTSSRITVRWNIPASAALSDVQKERLLLKLASSLTEAGDLIIHHSASRSQYQNKEEALKLLAETIRKALRVPKKRKKTGVPKGVKEARLKEKRVIGERKKGRRVPFDES